MSKDDTRITLGIITGAHGVHGRVKIRSYTEIPENIAAYGPLSERTGERSFTLRITGRLKDALLAEIEGVTRREHADALRGTELCVARNALPERQEGEFLIEELIGAPVKLEDGSRYGSVKAFHNYGAGDIIEITPENGKDTELVIFCTENFPSVSAEGLTFHPPEILRVAADAQT